METWYMAERNTAVIKAVQVKIETDTSVILEDGTEISKFSRTIYIYEDENIVRGFLIDYLHYKLERQIERVEELREKIKNLKKEFYGNK